MEDAVKVIKRKFKHMKGFELHKVYFVDDEFSESTLQAVNAKGKKQGWTEKFTQVVYFQTDFQTPIKESDIKRIQSTYIMDGLLHGAMAASGG